MNINDRVNPTLKRAAEQMAKAVVAKGEKPSPELLAAIEAALEMTKNVALTEMRNERDRAVKAVPGLR